MYTPSKIFLSFIIPTIDDIRVKNTISSLLKAPGWDSTTELIVIVNNSPKYFYENLKRKYPLFNKKEDTNIKILYLSKGSIAKARNLGIKTSRGQYIVHVDSDCEVARNYIVNLKTHLFKRNFLVGRGAIKFTPCNNMVSEVNCRLKQMVYFSRKEIAYTPNLIVKRDLYKKIGFFDEKLFHGEDLEWSQRLGKSKISPMFVDNLVVIHFDHKSILKILITYFYYGIGRVYRFKKYSLKNKSFREKFKISWHLFDEIPDLRKIHSFRDKMIILFLYLIRDIGVIAGLLKWIKVK